MYGMIYKIVVKSVAAMACQLCLTHSEAVYACTEYRPTGVTSEQLRWLNRSWEGFLMTDHQFLPFFFSF